MTEEEETVESSDEPVDRTGEPPGATGPPPRSGGETEFDRVAKSFLQLEAEFDAGDRGEAGPPADGARRGIVVGAERVDAGAVPDGYPLEPGEEALALDVAVGDRETTVYLAWPAEGESVPLTWLLDAMDVDLGDLYGRELQLDRIDGYDTVRTPSERPRGTGGWGPGVGGGLGVVVGALGLLVAGVGPTLPLVALWLVATVGLLPYATYRDAWYLRTHSDWDGGPLFWAALAALPVVDVLAVAGYLRRRQRAAFFGDEPSLRARLSAALRSLL